MVGAFHNCRPLVRMLGWSLSCSSEFTFDGKSLVCCGNNSHTKNETEVQRKSSFCRLDFEFIICFVRERKEIEQNFRLRSCGKFHCKLKIFSPKQNLTNSVDGETPTYRPSRIEKNARHIES